MAVAMLERPAVVERDDLVWPVMTGDEIETTVTVKDISERSGTGFYVFETVSTNQDGDTVSVGTWTNIVRGD